MMACCAINAGSSFAGRFDLQCAIKAGCKDADRRGLRCAFKAGSRVAGRRGMSAPSRLVKMPASVACGAPSRLGVLYILIYIVLLITTSHEVSTRHTVQGFLK